MTYTGIFFSSFIFDLTDYVEDASLSRPSHDSNSYLNKHLIYHKFGLKYMSGGFNAAPPPATGSATDEEKHYQDMICLGRKGGHFSQGEKGPKPLSPGAFIRFIRIGIG